MKMYVNGLVSDLEKDTVVLNTFIKWSKKEITHLKKIENTINSPDSIISLDSIINILPQINFLNLAPGSLKKETFNTLVATGDVGLIPAK